ncbi:MAG: hypothetical protein WHS43_06320 [Aquificaceae bacterium]|jgi:predicted nuclease with TOPRIM domain|uniref:hypothetical protein n=1 Tax=Hydrogenobacter sp. Uz 6-8 TaxID=3384828 RepID=UPI0030B3D749
MKPIGENLRRLAKYRRQALILPGPLIIIFLIIALGYRPYMEHINKLKEEHKEKKELLRRYRERVEEIPRLKEELKALRERTEEATRICFREKNSEEAKSKFFQMVSSETQNMNLNLQEPATETYGDVDIFTMNISGRIVDIKPFLLFLEKMEKSGNVLVESLEIKVEDPNNPVTLLVNLKLVSCNLRVSP